MSWWRPKKTPPVKLELLPNDEEGHPVVKLEKISQVGLANLTAVAD
jgi:hypothetical protein